MSSAALRQMVQQQLKWDRGIDMSAYDLGYLQAIHADHQQP